MCVRFLTNILILFLTPQFTRQSITGVTYMDHFDFEERYSDVDECNPMYWYPLHLPEQCLQMFGKLIRSKLPFAPYKVVKETGSPVNVLPELIYGYNYIPLYADVYNIPKIEYVEPVEERILSPLEVLYRLLRRDVQDIPSAPTLGVSPYLGVIAMYKQPVSYKSVAMIKKIARAYGGSGYPFSPLGSMDNTDEQKHEKKVKINKKSTNSTVVVSEVIKSDDAMTLLKIKKFN